jgi:hypothetical protein
MKHKKFKIESKPLFVYHGQSNDLNKTHHPTTTGTDPTTVTSTTIITTIALFDR